MLGRWDHRVARLVGLAFVILGAWVLAVNLIEPRYSDWIMAWVLGSGVLGAAGGLAFLLSFDGPNRMRTRGVRFLGWMGMVVLAVELLVSHGPTGPAGHPDASSAARPARDALAVTDLGL